MKPLRLTLITMLPFLAGAGDGTAKDWPFYRGPVFNGTSTETGFQTTFPSGGPRILWKRNLGIGVSSFTTAGDRVLSMGNVDDQDIIYCIDAQTGRDLWTHAYPCTFEERMFEGGTSSTPTIDDDRVYALSYDGQLSCLKLADGAVVWKKHLVKDFGGRLSRWKYAGSPLIQGNLLILDSGADGKSTVALDKMTGNLVWGGGKDEAGYATVIPFQQGGTPALLVFKAEHMVAKQLADGRELWRIPWETSYNVNASSPLASGNRVFISSGYPRTGRGAMFDISGPSPRKLWETEELKTKMSSCAAYQGHIYGISEKKEQILCIEAATGNIVWSARGGGQFGNLVIAGGTLVILSDRGDLILAPATPKGFNPTAQAKILDHRCWVQPTLSHGRIFCRNNRGDVVCVDVR